MATQVLMPQLGLTMTEGLLTDWVKKEGDRVRKGDVLFNVENDKATLPVEAQADGVLVNITVKASETVPVGSIVAWILSEGETAGDIPRASPDETVPTKPAPPPISQSPAAAIQAPVVTAATAPGRAPEPADRAGRPSRPEDSIPEKATAASATRGSDGFILASPRARQWAKERSVDLGSLRGSGPGGSIVERDLPTSAGAASQGSGAFAQSPRSGEDSELITLPRIGQIGADRMTQSWTEIPQFTLYIEACAEELIRFQEKSKKTGTPVSVTVLLAGLLARALRDFPRLNASWAGEGKVRVYRTVNVGIAMDTPDGLVVPVLRDCAGKGLRTLAQEMKVLSEKGKSRSLSSDELSGGTITLSNLGMYGVRRFRAIVNPPQTAIIAAGAIERKPVENETGEILFRRHMELGVTSDHRAVDGAYAAKFLSAYKELIENPVYALL